MQTEPLQTPPPSPRLMFPSPPPSQVGNLYGVKVSPEECKRDMRVRFPKKSYHTPASSPRKDTPPKVIQKQRK
jgi:hypothetical protein